MERGHSPATRRAFALERLDATAALLDALDEQIDRAEADLARRSAQATAAPDAAQCLRDLGALGDLTDCRILRRRLSNTYARQAYEVVAAGPMAPPGPSAPGVHEEFPVAFWFRPPPIKCGHPQDDPRIEEARQHVLEALHAAPDTTVPSPAGRPWPCDNHDGTLELAWQLPDRLRQYADAVRAALKGGQVARR
ncbi:hypothetical protein [Kitasatospora sp. GAS204B]|uniref:hypothetical protein n=1 Tax=unclassified Kitasatospora TaxID=2633591 RepID=UPI0024762999|nr:hypothetical protein [Kitasatospora sp. GAS204B]MDH6119843.1 hypothetical protein [Kitasatospora sp. GAS204B]